MVGARAPGYRCIIFEGEKEHPLISEELMMPILGMVRAKNFDDAVEKCLWLEHSNKHSAHIHSVFYKILRRLWVGLVQSV
jgi:propionaldehyde dehydrogenase